MHTLDSTAYRAIAMQLDNMSLSIAALVVHHRLDTPAHDAVVTILAVDPDLASRELVIHAYVHRMIDRDPYHTDDPHDVYSVALLDATDPDAPSLDANACARLRLLASHV
jgi:hypothetical protein